MEAAALRRAPEAGEDIIVGGEDITTRGMRTDVVAVRREDTCCRCFRDAPARLALHYRSLARFDGRHN